MKDKNTAGVLALFLGLFGVHRFYLGQIGLGVLYAVFFPCTWFISFIDALLFFSMDKDVFDVKYNKQAWQEQQQQPDFQRPDRGRGATDFERREARPQAPPPPARKAAAERPNQYRQTGLEKFKDFDYAGAIDDFKKSLELAPQDIATHFNIACAYALTEDKEKAFSHLDKAVSLGFRDFQKLKEHHALAYLRIQNDFEQFEENGFRLPPKTTKKPDDENLLASQPNLFDRLKKLADLREQGLLTEQEFEDQRQKLMGR